MKKVVYPLAALLFIYLVLPAQNISYDVASIPASLKKGADVVKRYENVVFEVSAIDRATLKTHEVYTVLNEKGKRYLVFDEYVDKFRTLDDVEIKVYDSTGKQINRYKQRDLTLHAYSDGLVDDNKGYGLVVPVSTYPITVEYKYEQRYKGTLFYPVFNIMRPNVAVEQATYFAKVPKDVDLRYKARSIVLAPAVTEEEKFKVYQWSVKSLQPMEVEEGSVSRFPEIALAPNRFEYDDYAGDLSSWKNFGVWYANLNKGLDVLPPDRGAFLNDLVKDATNEREKIRRIYQYMQKNFRYVSIQLGIGGLKSFAANFTDQKKYGDCKALSNYMKAALKAVGIKSYVAVINAGADNNMPMDLDFPAPFANHVILCVPGAKDTVWLECTSKLADFGVLGNFTENRNALLITEDGGALVSTPTSRASDNKIQATTTITLAEGGEGKVNTLFHTSGEFKDGMNYILTEKEDDQKEFIVHALGFKQPDQFAFTKKEDTLLFTTALEMEVEKIPEFSAGNKMFLRPRMQKLWKTKLPKAENRTLDYYFDFPFEKTDTTIIKLPVNFTVDVLPKPQQLSCPYATYNTTYWFDDKQRAIYSVASFTIKRHRIPAAGYAEIKKMFDDILIDDTQRIVIKK